MLCQSNSSFFCNKIMLQNLEIVTACTLLQFKGEFILIAVPENEASFT